MKIKLGKYALCKVNAQEYNKKYDANVEERFGYDLEWIVWFEKYDDEGELVAMSDELMLVYTGNTFAYTSRGIVCKADFVECIKTVLYLEAF